MPAQLYPFSPELSVQIVTGDLPDNGGLMTARGGRRKFLSTGFSTEALPLIEKFWGDKVPFVQA